VSAEKAEHATLDDASAIAASDPSSMLSLAASVGHQLRDGYDAGTSASGLPSAEGVQSLVVCGMGGSGVVGDVLRCLYGPRLSVPITVCKGYTVPESCGRDTLVLAVSFSGDTEETLAAYAEAVGRGARVLAIGGGGELAALAEADGVARVAVPSDVPVPRAALGFLSGAGIGVLDAVGLVPPAAESLAEAADHLDQQAKTLGVESPAEGNEAKRLAEWLVDRTTVIWGSEGLAEAAAVRWKTQCNENAKVPAFWGVIPEIDHNEIEGWASSSGTSEPFAAVVLRYRGEHPRIAARVAATIEAVAATGLAVREVHATHVAPMAALFSLIMVGDFTSTYLGILRGVDPTPVPVLSGLKKRLRG
jgi:glucose/mannose-6-phosphate isomerase